MLDFRPATSGDAPAIARIIREVWPDETPDAGWIADLLARADHSGTVVLLDDSVVGFVEGFVTYSEEGLLRWEIDLMAVLPEARGQGAARELVRLNAEAGRARGAEMFRAIVRTGNLRAEGAFAANGFRMTHEAELWVGGAATAHAATPPYAPGHLVPVDTLTYRGVWVESRFDGAALVAAQQRALAEGRNRVGALIPLESDASAPRDAERLGFSLIERFGIWRLEREAFSSRP